MKGTRVEVRRPTKRLLQESRREETVALSRMIAAEAMMSGRFLNILRQLRIC